jgi:AraC-like DNA-binding protein
MVAPAALKLLLPAYTTTPYFCQMRLYIKNMVCDRCILVVKQELEKLGLPYTSVSLGEVELSKDPTEEQQEQLKDNLAALRFEILDDSRKRLIEKIKSVIIEEVHHREDQKHNFSKVLSQKLHKDYSYLSNLFSDVEGITIEKYVIKQKIEKAKELLVYDELNLSEISFRLGYSSVAHLSSQFKKITGLTPSHFKKIGGIHRQSLDKV